MSDDTPPAPASQPPASASRPARRSVRDVQTLKVFTHPLRITLLRLLHESGPATASLLGKRVDATPSLVSYHLRTLAAHAFVSEDPGHAEDGRERWWKVDEDLTFSFEDFADDVVGREMSVSLARVLGSQSDERYQRFLDDVESWGPQWAGAAFGGAPTLRLSVDELREMSAAIDALVDGFRGRETPGSQPVELYYRGFPYRI
ncbi:winged helix-turn-helix domain-containing protein [Streptomyces sp. SID3343]|uniref:winged helix-turn-helix domain-containing protein n=1 Tax=Streptomyces sp. SID3343 TaxID=2690260 RepID=UPI00136816AD|nr:winged helix-turn-helix domain-containing protein [Streptomyces sp. SID3343]MYW03951.1 helix-turn-helix domain-containing protein [Streptomyces sp. SID3343]